MNDHGSVLPFYGLIATIFVFSDLLLLLLMFPSKFFQIPEKKFVKNRLFSLLRNETIQCKIIIMKNY